MTTTSPPTDIAVRPSAAMVLGAGLGARMRPLTLSVPKPLVPLAGRPLIDHVLDRLADAGITKAVVNVHYLADQMEAHLARRRAPKIEISDERGQILDTGGGVAKALGQLGEAPFLIHNSDSVWMEGDDRDSPDEATTNLDRLIAAFDPAQMDCLLMLARVATSLGYDGAGDFEMDTPGDATGRLTRQVAPNPAAYVFAGVSIMRPQLFEAAPSGAFSLNLLWNKAMENGRLHGICANGIWMHVGDPAALELAERQLRSGSSEKL